ncbi:AAA family ATPase [Morganella morganii]|uniref:AAA family ATPase n=1 Tax=Morganella morganii TaxID=582 RepID=UPI002864CC99|nr:AAA family ATPase [Morganella morganii]MDR5686138.1 AAA family ATPase [Morganella morganii]
MINNVIFNNQDIPISRKIKNSNNIYTIVIGKNGTGKSRLLQLICEQFISGKGEHVKLNYTPSRVIAISTTLFDKFPLKTNSEKGYFYQGIKGIQTQEVSKGYISKFIGDFLAGVISNKINSLSQALDYLGYDDEININFRYIGGSRIQNIIEMESSYIDNMNFISSNFNVSDDFFNISNVDFDYKGGGLLKEKKLLFLKVNRLRDYLYTRCIKGEEQINLSIINNNYKMSKLLLSIKKSPWIHATRKLNLKVKGEHLEFNKNFILDMNFINLIESGLFKVESVVLRKNKSKEKFEIENASSGEQSVIISILGISSIIKDKSLILIDEPEVCLHPEWQEKYIKLLMDIFKNKKKCHFIIATHSPQIIANLKDNNCFITSIEDGLCTNAKSYIKKSSDFQLAKLFNAPGFKNEYLSRLSLNLLSKIMANKSIDSDDKKEILFLISIKEKLSKDDPILDLIISLEQIVSYYA